MTAGGLKIAGASQRAWSAIVGAAKKAFRPAGIPAAANRVRVTQVYEPVPRPWKQDPGDSTRSITLTNSELIDELSTCFKSDGGGVVIPSRGRSVRLSIRGGDVQIPSEKSLDELTEEEALRAEIVFQLEFVEDWPSDLVARDDLVTVLTDAQRKVNERASALRYSGGRTVTARRRQAGDGLVVDGNAVQKFQVRPRRRSAGLVVDPPDSERDT
jgi:hypothetical protein